METQRSALKPSNHHNRIATTPAACKSSKKSSKSHKLTDSPELVTSGHLYGVLEEAVTESLKKYRKNFKDLKRCKPIPKEDTKEIQRIGLRISFKPSNQLNEIASSAEPFSPRKLCQPLGAAVAKDSEEHETNLFGIEWEEGDFERFHRNLQDRYNELWGIYSPTGLSEDDDESSDKENSQNLFQQTLSQEPPIDPLELGVGDNESIQHQMIPVYFGGKRSTSAKTEEEETRPSIPKIQEGPMPSFIIIPGVDIEDFFGPCARGNTIQFYAGEADAGADVEDFHAMRDEIPHDKTDENAMDVDDGEGYENVVEVDEGYENVVDVDERYENVVDVDDDAELILGL